MQETPRCSGCRLLLTGSKKYYRFTSEIGAYTTCVVCVAKAVRHLKAMKDLSPEMQDLLEQLETMHKQKPIHA